MRLLCTSRISPKCLNLAKCRGSETQTSARSQIRIRVFSPPFTPEAETMPCESTFQEARRLGNAAFSIYWPPEVTCVGFSLEMKHCLAIGRSGRAYLRIFPPYTHGWVIRQSLIRTRATRPYNVVDISTSQTQIERTYTPFFILPSYEDRREMARSDNIGDVSERRLSNSGRSESPKPPYIPRNGGTRLRLGNSEVRSLRLRFIPFVY